LCPFFYIIIFKLDKLFIGKYLFLKFSQYIVKHSFLILSLICISTSFLFYYSFLSENKLKVDFSLEQMFPNSDPDRDIYDDFKAVYGREDNVIFLSVTNNDTFSNDNLSILEMITNDLKSINRIDFAFSLGTLWDDGDGLIGVDLDKEKRREKIDSNILYSSLLSNDSKSSLIILKIDEEVKSHEIRKDIFEKIDLIQRSYKFKLVYDNKSLLNTNANLLKFYSALNVKESEFVYIFSNDNVLSDFSVGPYSALESLTKGLNGDIGLKVKSINDCYYKINNDTEQDLIIEQSIIKSQCSDLTSYISNDLKYTAIKIDPSSNSSMYIKDYILKNSYINYNNWEWHEAGLPVLRTRYIELVEYERFLFIPLAFLIAALTLIFVFRQVKSLFIALFSIVVSLIWASAIMSLLDISINVISYLTFNLLMVIGVSDAIHLLMKYHEESNNNADKVEALKKVIVKIGSALFLTSFTTAVGFLSLTITNVRILQEFGIIMGIGIGILFVVTITVMPCILLYINPPDQRHIDRLLLRKESSASYNILKLVLSYPKKIIGFSCLIFIISIYSLTKIDSNVDVLGDLKPGNKLYEDINFVEDKFGGTLPLEIIIDVSDDIDLINNNLFYNKVKLFSNKLINYESIKTLDSYWGLDGQLNSQLNKYTNTDRSQIRISCGIKNINSSEASYLKSQIRNDYNSIFNNDSIKITGSTLLALKMNKYLIKSLLSSFLIAFIIIFISIIFLFKSFKLSLVAILPNLLPLLFAGFVMAIFGIELRPATAMTFSIALGIAVDDTIHFLSRFKAEFDLHHSHEKAISITILTTGRAIISTTITLAMGFLVLIFSNFKPNYEFGILSTVILVVALMSSLILLPSLINYVKPLNKNE